MVYFLLLTIISSDLLCFHKATRRGLDIHLKFKDNCMIWKDYTVYSFYFILCCAVGSKHHKTMTHNYAICI